MHDRHKAVLIFGQNGRFLAQSATQAGYCVWVADCFGDYDLVEIADRWQSLDSISDLTGKQFNALLLELSRGEACYLICGSGIEQCFQFLATLPDNIELVGNTLDIIQTVKTPRLFFDLLHGLTIPFPETHFSLPVDFTSYLAKSACAYGGLHIQKAAQHCYDPCYYFQRFIEGRVGSVLFLADGQGCQLLSINRQYLSATVQAPFRLDCIETPWNILERHHKILAVAISKIAAEIGLLGLNSLDFIISNDDELMVLEINPRPSASAELIDDGSLFQHHINACHGVLPVTTLPKINEGVSLKTIYADYDLTIATSMRWPSSCRDIPHAGTLIKEGQPIVSSLHWASSVEEFSELHRRTKKEIFNQCIP